MLLGGVFLNKKSFKSARKLAISSILTALSIISLWLSSVLFTGRLALLGLCACFSSLVFSSCGKKYGLLHYFAVTLLAFLFVPKNAQFFSYVLFLGYYPFLRLKVKPLFIRAIIFTVIFALSFIFLKNILLPGFTIAIYQYIIGLIGGIIVFFIFDYALFYFEIFTIERLSFLYKDN